MLTREGLLKGGENSDKVLVPGNAKASDMFIAVTWADKEMEMPPKENDRLKPEQIDVVRAWIDAGAPWPSEAEQKKLREAEWAVVSNEDGVIWKTSGGLADAWTYRRYKPEDLWAFPTGEEACDPGRKSRKSGGSFHRRQIREGEGAAGGAGRSADVDPPRDLRPARPAADAGRSRRVSRRVEIRCRPRPGAISSTACSPVRTTANAGRSIGSMSRAMRTPAAWRMTSSARTCGAIATT